MRTILVAGLMAGSIALSLPALAQSPNGKRLFQTRCAQCHWDPARMPEQPRIGPGLRGVVGRPAAANASFKRYSAALRHSGIVWNDRMMNAYLENPRKLAPGTSMAFAGLRALADRAAVIAYLKSPK